jgi:hypothetical protein
MPLVAIAGLGAGASAGVPAGVSAVGEMGESVSSHEATSRAMASRNGARAARSVRLMKFVSLV